VFSCPAFGYHAVTIINTTKKIRGGGRAHSSKARCILLLLIVFVGIPTLLPGYYLSVGTMVGYTAMGALGVQLLIGYTGLVTLGHAAFIAVGAYTSTLLVLQFPWPQFFTDLGLAYPISIVVAGLVAGIWSVIFGLPSAKVKGFYLIPHHHGLPSLSPWILSLPST